LVRNVSRKPDQPASLIDRASRSFWSIPRMSKLSTATSPYRRTNFKATWW